jgi:hypothetical protein
VVARVVLLVRAPRSVCITLVFLVEISG